MTRTKATGRAVWIGIGIVLIFILAVGLLWPVVSAVEGQTRSQSTSTASNNTAGVPQFQWDPTWPKQPFPNDWVLGMVLGAVVDTQDHLWISHRAGSLTPWEAGASADPPRAGCCTPAPSVIEFDYEGNIVRSWGGGDVTGYDWLEEEHGMTIDHEGNVWVAASSREDSRVLKFTPDGQVLLQIGEQSPPNGSNDTHMLGLPADMSVDAETNEVWIADGYGNRRVIIFDANTGAYKRHFGAYGNRPDDEPFRYDHTTDARRLSSSSCLTASSSRTTGWCTCVTVRQAVSRSSARMGRSWRKRSLRKRSQGRS